MLQIPCGLKSHFALLARPHMVCVKTCVMHAVCNRQVGTIEAIGFDATLPPSRWPGKQCNTRARVRVSHLIAALDALTHSTQWQCPIYLEWHTALPNMCSAMRRETVTVSASAPAFHWHRERADSGGRNHVRCGWDGLLPIDCTDRQIVCRGSIDHTGDHSTPAWALPHS